MSTNGKGHHSKIQALKVCRRCEVGVYEVMMEGEWRGVQGDATILFHLKVDRYFGLCPTCHSQVGQEFVL